VCNDWAFAEAVVELARDRDEWRGWSVAGRRDARERFEEERVAGDYEALLRRWSDQPAPEYEPLAWSEFRVPDDLQNRCVRAVIKRGLKRVSRMWLLYLKMSNWWGKRSSLTASSAGYGVPCRRGRSGLYGLLCFIRRRSSRGGG
jgi:hypothetical protein